MPMNGVDKGATRYGVFKKHVPEAVIAAAHFHAGYETAGNSIDGIIFMIDSAVERVPSHLLRFWGWIVAESVSDKARSEKSINDCAAKRVADSDVVEAARRGHFLKLSKSMEVSFIAVGFIELTDDKLRIGCCVPCVVRSTD